MLPQKEQTTDTKKGVPDETIHEICIQAGALLPRVPALLLPQGSLCKPER